MSRPYILSECHWPSLKLNDYQLAVLPWGATEAHNYHLPYGTDTLETMALVEEAARMAWEAGARLIVLPAVPFGVNTGQKGIPFTMNMLPSTQQAILHDIAEDVSVSGIDKLLVVNGHGGNNFRQIIRELGHHHRQLFLATCNWFQSVDREAFFENEGDHADEMETSLMLHAWPSLVKPLEEAGDGRAKAFAVKELNESWAWTERKWTEVSRDTGIGDPRRASAEKGAAYFAEVSRKLCDLFTGLCSTPSTAMYK
ncbi:MAG: amidase [Bacteroidetes bacterium]|nr:MAG: amidase [Bacteroidota bacterium]